MDRTRRGGGGRADDLVLLAAMAINMAPSLRADETAAKAAGKTFDADRAGGAGVGEGMGPRWGSGGGRRNRTSCFEEGTKGRGASSWSEL